MRPGDHPEFFRLPAPNGASRESTIRLDARGQFFHDGAPIVRPDIQRAFFRWLGRHPENGRYILQNGYDWTYITIDDVPYFVEGIALEPYPQLLLSDGSREAFPDTGYRLGQGGSLYCPVKGGHFDARFLPSSQLALAPLLVEDGNELLLDLGTRRLLLPQDLASAR